MPLIPTRTRSCITHCNLLWWCYSFQPPGKYYTCTRAACTVVQYIEPFSISNNCIRIFPPMGTSACLACVAVGCSVLQTILDGLLEVQQTLLLSHKETRGVMLGRRRDQGEGAVPTGSSHPLSNTEEEIESDTVDEEEDPVHTEEAIPDNVYRNSRKRPPKPWVCGCSVARQPVRTKSQSDVLQCLFLHYPCSVCREERGTMSAMSPTSRNSSAATVTAPSPSGTARHASAVVRSQASPS